MLLEDNRDPGESRIFLPKIRRQEIQNPQSMSGSMLIFAVFNPFTAILNLCSIDRWPEASSTTAPCPDMWWGAYTWCSLWLGKLQRAALHVYGRNYKSLEVSHVTQEMRMVPLKNKTIWEAQYSYLLGIFWCASCSVTIDVYDGKTANGTEQVSVGLVYHLSVSLYLILGLLVLPGCCQNDFQRCCAGGSEAEGSSQGAHGLPGVHLPPAWGQKWVW